MKYYYKLIIIINIIILNGATNYISINNYYCKELSLITQKNIHFVILKLIRKLHGTS